MDPRLDQDQAELAVAAVADSGSDGESDPVGDSDGDDALSEGVSSEGVSSDDSDGGKPAPSVMRGPAHERRQVVLPEERCLGVMWQAYADAIIRGHVHTGEGQERCVCSTLSSIITQYEEMEDGEERAKGYAASREQLASVPEHSAEAINVGAIFRGRVGY